MNLKLKIPKFLLHLILLSSSVTYAQYNPKVQTVLNSYEDSLKDYGIVALVDDGKQTATGKIGFASKNMPIALSNRFCIGSCTKMFTSVLILKLQEKGLLTISDSLYKYIPAHQFIDSTITIKQLLNHTSGLTEILKNNFLNAPFIDPYGDFSDRMIYSKIDTIAFEKGTQYSYCNTNYFILSKIIERVTDRSYEANLQELIINPLQLKNTFPYHSNSIENLAHPIIDGKDLHKFPKMANSVLSAGSGNIVSDLFDLNKFLRALLIDKTLLNEKSIKLMLDFHSNKKEKIGLGIFQIDAGNRTFTGHTGRQISYITYAFVDMNAGESIVVINNNANDDIIDLVFEALCKLKN